MTPLLKPVEAAWQSGPEPDRAYQRSLGLLPLGLLPTGLPPAHAVSRCRYAVARYRDVAWLARSHAVTMVPSAASLRTLRQLPPGSDKRETLIGFGDPYFSP